jgi:hypothetical protein
MFAANRGQEHGDLTMTLFKKIRFSKNSPVVIWAVISLVLVIAVATLLLIRELISEADGQSSRHEKSMTAPLAVDPGG